MTPERWRAVKAILQEALERPAAERPAVVARACGDDTDLRAEVDSLLAAPDTGQGADGFLLPRWAELPTVAAATNAAEVEARLAASLDGRYVLERLLGRGGMATVYLARDVRHRRPVALKVLDTGPSAHVGPGRFRREIDTVATLSHPHVLPLHDSGDADGLLYYVMPYVPGESLRARLRHDGRLPVGDALRVVREVASALDHAHRRGVVHRDVKPDNILLDEDGHALVADFGIARALHDRGERRGGDGPGTLTGVGLVIGTPAYMSPEQALGRPDVSGQSDQYALACVAFELLTGAPPFAGCDAEQLALRLTTPPSLASAHPALPTAASAVLARALAYAPAARFETAGAFADALAEALADARTNGASRGGVGGHARRRAARRAIGVALAVCVAAGGWWALAPRGRDVAAAGTRTAVGARPAAGAEPAGRARSLAVLPLRNHSGDPAQEYFADGMTEELTTTLARIEALHVVAHQSVRQFKRSARPVPQIARMLGVRYLVDGSVLREGERVRITATLIDATTNASVWTERFERERHGVLALQREVALAVAGAVSVALTPQDSLRLADASSVDPAVFDLYIRGTQARYRSFGDDVGVELRYFERAIARDPTYAPAHAGLAFSRAMIGDEAGARRSVARALALDPKLPEAHMALGLIRQLYEWNWAGAESAFREAIRLNPGFAEAHHELSMLLMRRGRFADALREARETVYLAPMSARFEHGIGEVLLSAGRGDEALAAAEKALTLEPSSGAAYFLMAYAQLQRGRPAEAEAALRKCMALGCGDEALALLGHVYAVTGRPAAARRVIDSLRVRESDTGAGGATAFGIAQVLVGLGEREAALDWLEHGVRSHQFMVYMAVEPTFRPLRAEPRFQAMLRALRLAE